MPRKPKIDWAAARAYWETGKTDTATAKKFGVSRRAVQMHRVKEGWRQDLEGEIQKRTDAKLGKSSGKPPARDAKKTDEAVEAEATRRAEVLNRHRQEWLMARDRIVSAVRNHRAAKTGQEKASAFQDAKMAKITAEATQIVQLGERRAWGIEKAEDRGLLEVRVTYHEEPKAHELENHDEARNGPETQRPEYPRTH